MRKYTLAQLEAFKSIVEFGSFGAAAGYLNVTQPTISLRIRELESALGRRLLDRDARHGKPTPDGHVFHHYVERLITMLDEMDRRMRTGDPLQGVLRLGASDTFAVSCLPQLLSQLDQRMPQLRVELTVTASAQLGHLLDERLIDIAFMTTTPVAPHVQVAPLARSPLAWFAGGNHRDTGRALRPADVAHQRLLTLPAGTPLHSMMTQWFEANDEPVPGFSTCTDTSMVLRLVRAGHAWSLLPVCIAQSDEASVLPAIVKVTRALPALSMCSAIQSEGASETLGLIVSMAEAIVRQKPGLELP